MMLGGHLHCRLLCHAANTLLSEFLLDFPYNILYKTIFIHDYGLCWVNSVDDTEAICYTTLSHYFFHALGDVHEFCSVSCWYINVFEKDLHSITPIYINVSKYLASAHRLEQFKNKYPIPNCANAAILHLASALWQLRA